MMELILLLLIIIAVLAGALIITWQAGKAKVNKVKADVAFEESKRQQFVIDNRKTLDKDIANLAAKHRQEYLDEVNKISGRNHFDRHLDGVQQPEGDCFKPDSDVASNAAVTEDTSE